MLTRKIEPHQKWSSSAPPISGPAAKPRELTAPHRPMALVRSASSKTWTMTARVVVISSAPPTPMPARAAISSPVVWERAAASEPRPKRASPTASSFLRP